MTSPEQLGIQYVYPCNDTHGYCTFIETYNLEKKEVTSFYRQCSITNRGNGCTEDATKLACVGSCRGEFCTKHETGRRYEIYIGSTSTSTVFSSTPRRTSSPINTFDCYQCSYNKLYDVDKERNDIRCMTSPEQLGKRYIYPCNDTHGYCTFSETYNLARKEVTSFYRQCSITYRGDGCTEDATNLVCIGSCRKDFCTKNETGRRYEIYFESTSTSTVYSSTQRRTSSPINSNNSTVCGHGQTSGFKKIPVLGGFILSHLLIITIFLYMDFVY
ncbi:uncharacterized protein LOC132738101 isoform X2 [Ruditapes philippinarum]|uniref:uncharacterized protein LOC132738101 isoform X2 n=1 Tax=Ruditapes philippinarum TaxID=129788 RepID=UPI00295AD6C3|nr:uncharacterized protein LOC132738101 isoform X2 [Ruditapes philippinarum]